MLKRPAYLVGSGVKLIVLLALDDRGAPSYNRQNAARLAAMGACVCLHAGPVPDMMAAAMKRSSLEQWAAQAGIVHA
ncbi:hypothetical protein [Massilia consociata]|uniref:hypothetical protein n=1 Tax=Massilia consociata TaxID=760117 RepID=UPI00406BAEA0